MIRNTSGHFGERKSFGAFYRPYRRTSCIGTEAPITHGDVTEQDDCGPTGGQKIQHQGRRHAQSNRATRQYDERPGAFGL